jgi:heme exporter protein D
MNELFIADFMKMDGYGLYVWLVYGMALLVFLYNLIVPLWKHHHLLSCLSHQKKMLKRSHESNS